LNEAGSAFVKRGEMTKRGIVVVRMDMFRNVLIEGLTGELRERKSPFSDGDVDTIRQIFDQAPARLEKLIRPKGL
jgi:hypothetical protein